MRAQDGHTARHGAGGSGAGRDGVSAREEPAARHAPEVPPPRGRTGRLAAWWGRQSGNLRGSLHMLAALVFFAGMVALIKAVGSRIPIVEVLVIRQVVMTALLAPFFARDWRAVLATSRPGLQAIRGLFSLGAMLCGFTAVVHLPLAEVTAIGFSQALFVTIAAVVVLRERVGARRWLATLVGFAGVVIVLRPGAEGISPHAGLAIAGAACGAGITVSVRLLGATERTETILLYQAIVLLAALAVPTWIWWVTPGRTDLALLILIGALGTLGQWFVTKAYQVGEASALAPIDFLRLLISVATGFLVFAEVPGPATLAGGLLVAGAVTAAIRGNARGGPARP